MKKVVILIPAYQPDEKLLPLTRALAAGGYPLIVVDDGSGEEYAPLFAQVGQNAAVLHHPENRGKGRALKTGIQYSAEQGFDAVVTADADGQHSPEDILALCKMMTLCEGTLVLGCRSVDQMPPKSRLGNSITRFLFGALYGVKVSDTQTGLRGIPLGEYTGMLLDLEGERYEYEMNMLIQARRLGLEIQQCPIRTIYYDSNAGSHFHPLRDGFKIYRVLLRNIPSFIGASFGSFLIDYCLFTVFYALSARVLLSTVLARVISASCNYLLNKRLVFRQSGKAYNARRYALLAVCILAVNCLLMYLLTQVLPVPAQLAKLFVELTLYIVSYSVQSRWAHAD